MKKPNVLIKNFKTFQGHEGYGMNCDVYIEGVLCLHAHDNGNGGCLDINGLAYGSKDPERVMSLIRDLNQYLEEQPEKPWLIGGEQMKDKDGNLKMHKETLEDFINELTYEAERLKEQKKFQKQMLNCILFGVPNADTYQRYKFSISLVEFAKTNRSALQSKVDRIKSEYCTEGRIILNTNLKELGINF